MSTPAGGHAAPPGTATHAPVLPPASPRPFPTKILGAVVGGIAVVALIVFAYLYFSRRHSDKPSGTSPAPAPAPGVTTRVPEYPMVGQGHATEDKALKAWLDPQNSHTRFTRPVEYVFVEDDNVRFVDSVAYGRWNGAETEYHKKWWAMPAGRYKIFPLHSGDEPFVEWW